MDDRSLPTPSDVAYSDLTPFIMKGMCCLKKCCSKTQRFRELSRKTLSATAETVACSVYCTAIVIVIVTNEQISWFIS